MIEQLIGKGRFLFHFIEHHPGVDIIFLIKHNEIPNILGKLSNKVYFGIGCVYLG